MDSQTFVNLGLVLLFVLVGGVFAATEIALVSLRDSQVTRMERESARGARVAAIARDPNRFLAAVQIGVTVAGFFSAAYGGSTLAPDVAPYLVDLGLPSGAADTAALASMTLLIAYFSLVLGELVPKRLALQRSAQLSLLVGPPLDRFATVMRPVIWLLSRSTDALVRVLGGDPSATNDELSEDELRDIVATHEGLDEQERRILADVFAAARTTVKEVMRPRREVAFLDGDLPLAEAVEQVRGLSWSRYPVTGEGGFDDITGFLHVRDLLDIEVAGDRRVRDVQRDVLVVPETNHVLPTVTQMRREGVHLAVVVDEYGGTDGIVTLEDLVEEIVGEIRDEHDAPEPEVRAPDGSLLLEGGLSIEDFAERTGVELEDGDYETVAGYVVARLGRIAEPGDAVEVDDVRLRVAETDAARITRVAVETGAVTDEG
ncbi:hemolysin family protein [Nocardioides abyssi]|uniref:Hemolysin family protein n=1 Tax=Nocardioides abyssi TaxID=3058370 RepID=A0ABT8ERG0_9ACTN|nr:hemolysin family protein [Nocardioides abyssi]MDN4160709.1 hemolysin family protein [Nocardioides abyssi]